MLTPLPQKQHPKILVITNLYPPQELGVRSFYLRFCGKPRLLGHNVQVLSSNAPYLGGDLREDQQVNRQLLLLGSYEGSLTEVKDLGQRMKIISHNELVINQLVSDYRPQAVLLGNLDMPDT